MSTWRAVPGWEGIYEASADGELRRVDGQRVSTWMTPNGYVAVALRGPGRTQKTSVHIAVLSTFAGPRPSPKHVTRHLDGVRTNNAISNLRWGTQSENILDAVDHGTHTNAAKTECPQGHPYSEENTLTLTSTGHRKCRECDRQASREYYYANREARIASVARYQARKRAEALAQAAEEVAS